MRERRARGGRLFVVQGDLTKLSCDAWLLPTDRALTIETTWFSDAPKWIDAKARAVRVDGRRAWRLSLRRSKAWESEHERVLAVRRKTWKSPRPWLVNVSGLARTPVDWYLDGVRAFLDAAIDALDRVDVRARTCRRAKPLLAVPMVGTGYGGAANSKAEMVAGLVETLHHEAARRDVDLALVTADEASYAAAQRARGGVDGDLDPSLVRTSERLAALARARKLVLFLGAGVSAPAGLPLWDELIDGLAVEASFDETQRRKLSRMNSLDAAQVIARRMGDAELRREVVQRIRAVGHHTLSHALLASLPCEEAITTNYDELFELAVEGLHLQNAIPMSVLPRHVDPRADRWLLKMHGTLDDPDRLVLTREDALRYGDQRAALAGIVQAMLLTKHMLFVGFSLNDDVFHGIADVVRKALPPDRDAPFATALSPRVDELKRMLWDGDIELVDTSSSHDGSRADASRRLEIFLDDLAARAGSHEAHFLDPKYARALAGRERDLAERLRALRDEFGEELEGSPAWTAVDDLLKKLGDRAPRKRSRAA